MSVVVGAAGIAKSWAPGFGCLRLADARPPPKIPPPDAKPPASAPPDAKKGGMLLSNAQVATSGAVPQAPTSGAVRGPLTAVAESQGEGIATSGGSSITPGNGQVAVSNDILESSRNLATRHQ
jgi:hypothetical protein